MISTLYLSMYSVFLDITEWGTALCMYVCGLRLVLRCYIVLLTYEHRRFFQSRSGLCPVTCSREYHMYVSDMLCMCKYFGV